MFYVGIDIGKRKHVASMLAEDTKKKPIFKGLEFTNTIEGAKKLIARISETTSDKEQVFIGMEATGHYWLGMYSYLRSSGYTIHIINPILTDSWRKGVEIRKRKTDQIDSELIADLIRYHKFDGTELLNEDVQSLRTLTRFRGYQVDTVSDLKRKIICILDQIFPEYQDLFSDIFGTTSKELLQKYASPAELETVPIDKLTEFLQTASRKRCGAEKAAKILEAAKHSFGISFESDALLFELRSLLNLLDFTEQQIAETDAEINAIMEKLNSPITTIPGIGKVLGAAIYSEIGDIKRFSSPSKLVAYAGIDARIAESGEYEATNNRMSKRGSPHLRRALYIAANSAVRTDPDLKAYYERKIAEGKHHNIVLGAISRKLCNIIYAILRENRPYKKH